MKREPQIGSSINAKPTLTLVPSGAKSFPIRLYWLALVPLVLALPLFFLRGVGLFDDSVVLEMGLLVRRGFLPYRDFFDNKPPLVSLLSATIATVGQESWLFPRFVLFGFGIFTTALLFRYLVKQRTRPLAVFLTLMLFTLSFPLTQGYSLHTENPVLVFAMLGLVFFPRRPSEHWEQTLLCGLCLGLAAGFKQTALTMSVGTCIAIMLRRSEEGFSQKLKAVAAFLVGVAIPVVSIFAWALQQHIVGDMWDAICGKGIVAFQRYPFSLKSIAMLCAINPAILVTLGSLLLLATSSQLRARIAEAYHNHLDVWVWAGSMYMLTNLRTSWGAGHYSHPCVAAFAIVNGYVLAEGILLLSRRYLRLFSAALVVGLFGYLGALGYGGYKIFSTNALAEDSAVGKQLSGWLSANALPTDPILVFSPYSPPRLYYMSRQPSANKYLHSGIESKEINPPSKILERITTGKAGMFAMEIPRKGCLPLDAGEICSTPLESIFQYYDVTELETPAPRWGRLFLGKLKAPR